MNEHIFVIRIWWEYREIEGESPSYRGMIQDVTTGEKHYFRDLNTTIRFIAPYLEEMHVKAKLRWPLKLWSAQVKHLSNT